MFKLLPLISTLICFLLSSCLELEIQGKVDRDGSGEWQMVSKSPAGNPFDKDAPLPTTEELAATQEEEHAKEKEKAQKSGVTIIDHKIELQDRTEVRTISVSFENIDQLNAYFNATSSDKEPKTEIIISDSGSKKKFEFNMVMESEEHDPSEEMMMKQMLGSMTAKFNWTFPGKVSEASNDGEISDDGNSVKWEMPLSDLVTDGFHLSASYTNPSNSGTRNMIIVGVIIALVIGFVAFKKVKK